MTEFDLIYRYFEQQKQAVADHKYHTVVSILKSLGDDAAVIDIKAQMQWITCVDTLVQGRHFSADWAQVNELAFAIGFKAVAVNVSDIIAMGATPHSILLALSLPQRLANKQWLNQFAKGLFHACNQFGVRLIGGDTTRHDSLVISVTANGVLPTSESPIYRSGAQVGDKVYVTGTIGDASYALKHPDTDIGKELAHRLHTPTPRVALAQTLVTTHANAQANTDRDKRPTAMIDISDGLVQDLTHICNQSGVVMRLDLEQLPASKPLQRVAISECLRHQLTGGDDYELLFTLPKHVDIATLPNPTNTPVTCIGSVVAKAKLDDKGLNTAVAPVVLFYNGDRVSNETPFPFTSYPDLAGFQHFKSNR